ncbi:PS-10 peptidase S37 [Actinokineospora alba]|uniref:PS-10 peptidase S37 n=1 Tax=Actinokineospora alba TaxID=504798 RepID=A0A1H0GFM3_9PSEU|nr:S28 family serine protease [Actinokineospora alba]TDP69875.1 PS-10 peptidase S37 [Actinokineospora alba]SDI06886.1 PS-10 peptidase S37 [Actinokineospora alba]SDO05653.1 PS-10 peptidase S37 [Actinokineospora alba]
MLIRRSRTLAATLVAAAAMGLIATGVSPVTAAPVAQSADIADQLRAIPGLTVVSESATPPAGYRFFMLTYNQPVDHRDPSGQRFEQRFQLLHKATDRPMILHTTGYNMPANAFRSEPTRLVDGNQISVEQRFFSPSRPDPADWDDLNIWQAATDHHRLVDALDGVYAQKWISTGASKGGMTSVYHRRFYPGDVDGVVAYVAPNDKMNRLDGAYDKFFDTVGSDADCRARLDGVQREALTRRPEMLEKYKAHAAADGMTFNQVFGDIDKAFEMVVLDTAWAFWQYSKQADCATVPAATATTDELYTFIDNVSGFSFYSDQGILPYAPYFRQAATQLGWPSLTFDHLKGLTKYPGLYQANSSLPENLRARHDAWPMLDIDSWVRTRSSEMLFVYGQNDPWGAEPFVPSGRDSFTYTAPGANHGANIAALTPTERDAATAALRRWAGITVPTMQSPQSADITVPEVTDLDRAEPRNIRRPL